MGSTRHIRDTSTRRGGRSSSPRRATGVSLEILRRHPTRDQLLGQRAVGEHVTDTEAVDLGSVMRQKARARVNGPISGADCDGGFDVTPLRQFLILIY